MSPQIFALRRYAEKLYARTGYHSWSHALNVWENCQIFADRCRHYGIAFNPVVIEAAAILHDVAYALHPSDIFVVRESKVTRAMYREEVHTYLAQRIMDRLGFSSREIEGVKSAIPTTHPHEKPTTVEGKMLAASDTYSVGHGSYEHFVAEGQKIRREMEILNGTPLSLTEFVRGSASYLGQFMARRIRLGEIYANPDGRSTWHLGAFHNVTKQVYANKLAAKLVLDFNSNGVPAGSTGSEVVHDNQVIHVSVVPNWKWRIRSMQSLIAHNDRYGKRAPVMLAIPDEQRVVSLPSYCADEVYVSLVELARMQCRRWDPYELRRLLRPGGKLHLYEVEVDHLKGIPFTERDTFDYSSSWLKQTNFDVVNTQQTSFGHEAIYAAA